MLRYPAWKISLMIIVFVLTLMGIAGLSYFLGRNSAQQTQNKTLETSTKNTFNGVVYEISYPWNWTFEGPTEGPITGFPEFSKLISPSGDTQIVIGLKGDNRFEYVYDDIKQETKEANLMIGNKLYQADEQLFDVNEDPEFNIAVLEAEITDKYIIGYKQGAREAYLPMKIQILYRFSSEGMPFEEKMKMYESEKDEAIKILQTFKLKSN